MKKKRFNLADGILLILLALFVYLWYVGWQGMHSPLSRVQGDIDVSLSSLAYDLLRTNMRLLIGLGFSFLFAFIMGVWAAKSKHAANFILPFINFMESVPLVGFMTFSVTLALLLYPNNMMGLEYAAIFGVFTGQAWNMTLTVYQTIKVIPDELNDVAKQFKMTAWRKFWHIEAPYVMPGLLWNTMASQAAAWFALVGTEAIAVGVHTYNLPGVGSYIQVGLKDANIQVVLFAIIAIILNIILFDQLCFRPLVKWAEKFKYEKVKSRANATSWLYSLVQNSRFLVQAISKSFYYFVKLMRVSGLYKLTLIFNWKMSKWWRLAILISWYAIFSVLVIFFGVKLFHIIPYFSFVTILKLMFLTTARVAAAMLLSLIIFVPLGVWLGLENKRTRIAQPIIQVLAALPPNLFYPIVAMLLIVFHQSLGWWTIPLIMLGTQWYILFNVIAGVTTLPQDMMDVAKIFSLKGLYYWRKFIIPGIFPYIVTGIISAAGGAWNADITAEIIVWGRTTLHTSGLGAYISEATAANKIPEEVFGCILMCLLVALCIIFVWRPLYKLANTRYKIN